MEVVAKFGYQLGTQASRQLNCSSQSSFEYVEWHNDFLSQFCRKSFKLLNEGISDETEFDLSCIDDSLSAGRAIRKSFVAVNEMVA